MKNFYSTKAAEDYFSHSRPEMLPFVPKDAIRVLDVGCGRGAFGRLLKHQRALEVIGVELDDQSAMFARQALDKVYCVSVDSFDFQGDGLFDCIVFNDVLEHLEDPWSVLSRAKLALSPGGRIVISLPNVRFYPVLYELLKEGNWKYRESGVLDKTHLRFFTKKSMLDMLASVGLEVELISGLNWQQIPLFVRVLNRMSGGNLHDFCYPQFAIVAACPID